MGGLGERVDHVIGVDSHRDAHAAAICDRNGRVECEQVVPADAFGYRELLELARERAPGRRVWAVEGTGSYGAGLAAYLAGEGEWVVEIDRPARSRRAGKCDRLDAARAAREALARERLTTPRARGERAAIRALLVTRQSAVVARTKAIQLVRALVVSAPERLRAQLRGMATADLLRCCARLRALGAQPLEHRATVAALRSAARRALALEAEADELEALLGALVGQVAPQLLAEPGVGVVSASQLLVSWSHQGRLRSEAAFAQLAGACPVEASSGTVVRHRLNRGGDRQLNRALYTIVLSRMAHHPETRAYVARRSAEGKSPREIRRCLKRFLARRLYRLLEAGPDGRHVDMPPATPTPARAPAPPSSAPNSMRPASTYLTALMRRLVVAQGEPTTAALEAP